MRISGVVCLVGCRFRMNEENIVISLLYAPCFCEYVKDIFSLCCILSMRHELLFLEDRFRTIWGAERSGVSL